MSIKKSHHDGIDYYKKGEYPSLLVLSGMHGNESGIIPIVTEYIRTHEEDIRSYLHIPEVSPSAVVANTRNNRFDHDINRSFSKTVEDPESMAVMDIVSDHHFKLCLDFHEDPDIEGLFYMYDTGLFTPSELDEFRASMTPTGAGLFTGLDDPNDLNLGFTIDKGYVSFKHEVLNKDTGFLSDWMVRHANADRYFTLEIPGKSSPTVKKNLTEALFTYFFRYLS